MSTSTGSELNSIAIIGCGWLGTPLAHTLIERGFRVIATRSTPENVTELKDLGIAAIQLALRPGLECGSLESLRGIAIAIILLAPGIRKGCASQFAERISNLISGLKTVAISQVIFASSISVYPSDNREVDENEAEPPDSESGRILLEAEKRIIEDSSIQATVIRFAGLCGPGREPGRLLAGKDNLSGADNPVNLIHQQDAIEVLHSLIEHRPWGRIFNACAPCHPAKSNLYPSAAIAMGLAPPRFNQASARYKRVRGDKIREELGFVYRHPDPADWFW